MNTETKNNWPDEVRLKMIEESEFYQEPQIYQYGFYDGYQLAASQSYPRWVKAFQNIIKWCEESGLKDCDIGNPMHMAIYHSLHLAKNALEETPSIQEQK